MQKRGAGTMADTNPTDWRDRIAREISRTRVDCRLCGEPLASRSQWRDHLVTHHQVLPSEHTVAGQMTEPPAHTWGSAEDERG